MGYGGKYNTITETYMENIEQEMVNPLLARARMPGESFTLPSCGLLYGEGVLHQSSQNGEVRVHPMTAIDEITIKSPEMLFSGDAVRQVFERCIPQVLKPDELFARDIDFLLICLRKVSYGSEMELNFLHTCDDEKRSYIIDVSQFISTATKINPTTVERDFRCEMPNGQIVKVRPIRFGDFINIMQIADIDPSDLEALKNSTLKAVLGVIAAVDDITEPNMIYEWLEQVPPSFLRVINNTVEATMQWGPDFITKTKCRGCDEPIEIMAPLNPLSFFT